MSASSRWRCVGVATEPPIRTRTLLLDRRLGRRATGSARQKVGSCPSHRINLPTTYPERTGEKHAKDGRRRKYPEDGATALSRMWTERSRAHVEAARFVGRSRKPSRRCSILREHETPRVCAPSARTLKQALTEWLAARELRAETRESTHYVSIAPARLTL